MTEYDHVLLVQPDIADKISDELRKNASRYGVEIVVCNENGLQPLSEGLSSEDVKRLNMVLPKGINAAKGNVMLHRLNYRLSSLANHQTNKEQNNIYLR